MSSSEGEDGLAGSVVVGGRASPRPAGSVGVGASAPPARHSARPPAASTSDTAGGDVRPAGLTTDKGNPTHGKDSRRSGRLGSPLERLGHTVELDPAA